jgi:prepilin-type N-terminal cleavage/methylation domain-containing protein
MGSLNSKRQNINQLGMSLIEILIAMGILLIVMLAVANLQVSQMKEVRALSEKLAVLDLERLLISSLADGTICTAQLATNAVNPSAPYHIDSTALSTMSISLTSIPASSAVGAIPLISTLPSPAVSQIKIASIIVKNFISSGSPNQYIADLEVRFDSSLLVRALKPLTIKLNLRTDGADNISSCVGGGAPLICTTVSASVPFYGGSVSCPAGSFVTGGGCQPATGGNVTASTPSNNGWACSASSPSGTVSATAICCK